MGGGVIENIEVSYAGGKDMNFYDQMFNEKYVNPRCLMKNMLIRRITII